MPPCEHDQDCLGALACVDGQCGVRTAASDETVPCDGVAPCPDGAYCGGTKTCVHRGAMAAAGVYVAKPGVPSVESLGTRGGFVLHEARGPYPLMLQLAPAGPGQYSLSMLHGRNSAAILPSVPVYWYPVTTSSEQAALAAIPSYTGQTLTDDTYMAIAQRDGDRTVILRVYGASPPAYVALSRHFASTSVSRLAAGTRGFTHVLWVV